MKAITIQQPWATLISVGAKWYETRTWATKYRGPIAIHAGKQIDPTVFQPMLCPVRQTEELYRLGITHDTIDELPRGAVIAVADLVNVWRIVAHPGTNVDKAKHIPIGAESLTNDKHAPDFGDYIVPTEREFYFGRWIPGNFAWELQNVKFLTKPIPAKGQQGLWEWAPGVEVET